MQGNDDRPIVAALFLDRDTAHQHVERRFRGAIAMPSAQLIVRNAADSRGERGEHRAPGLGHDRQEMLGDERRADRVDRIGFGQPGGIKLAHRLFRAALARVQQAGGDDHQRGSRACGDMRRGCRNAGFVEQIEMLRAAARAREAVHLLERRFLDQRRLQRRANAARGPDDDCRAGHARVNRQRSGVLSAASKR
ncbi:hypothetical protein D9M73_128330 [compost metagenome]